MGDNKIPEDLIETNSLYSVSHKVVQLLNRTMIIGGGSCAERITHDLLERGVEVSVVSGDEKIGFSLPDLAGGNASEVLTGTILLKCRGAVGNFSVSMDQKGKTIERIVSHIVIAEEDNREPSFSLYGLIPSDYVLSLSQIKDLTGRPPHNEQLDKARVIVFLAGLLRETDPVITKEIMRLSLKLQSELNKKVYILAGNLKVAADGLEALYRKTRDAGVICAKFSSSLPLIGQGKDKRVTIEFDDEITGKQFKLAPDMTIVDEIIVPSDLLSGLPKVLNVDRDFAGFMQSDNVRRIPVYTNRKGIWVAGPSRTAQARYDHDIDAANAGLSVFALLRDNAPAPENKAEIDRGRCVRCLTCYRLCPFSAIRLDAKPVVVPEACEGCGICTAECPRTTISIKGLSVTEISNKIISPEGVDAEKAFVPFIVAFCCSRSASMAWKLTLNNNFNLPKKLNIIDVPCAGSISLDYIFLAIKKGADGIMILTCHEGNCHSEKGNIYARMKAERVLDLFDQMGLERQRLIIKTIASNMALEFSEHALKFEEQLIGLGVNRIKDSGNDKTG